MNRTRLSLAVTLTVGGFALGACAPLTRPTTPTSPWFPSTT